MGSGEYLVGHPLVERFSIYGLHGYKNLTLEFSGNATVVAAENGTGKTTLLNALNAFLSRRLHRLNSLTFHRIECKFRNQPTPVILHRQSIGANATDVELLQLVANKSNMTTEDVIDYVVGQYSPEKYSALKTRQASLAHALYLNTPNDEAKSLLDSLHQTYGNALTKYAKDVNARLQENLGDSEIIYLPTYRRVEKPLLRPSRKEAGSAYSAFFPGERDRKGTNAYQGVNFGLGDIEARLAELSEEIERESNFGYRFSSAQILQDMSAGIGAQLHLYDDDANLPTIDTLTLFLGRLGRSESNPNQLLQNIKRLYETNEIRHRDFAYLRYFLFRLGQVANKTKSLEQKIEKFVDICNSYLQMSSDEKMLAFDPSSLKVVVKNVWADAVIPLDELSSGEKQIVSLMAKLYLYEGNKVVLVDEPELSLSIDWQRKVLPDVMNSGRITQMLAITHSPFIFDNETKCIDDDYPILSFHRLIMPNLVDRLRDSRDNPSVLQIRVLHLRGRHNCGAIFVFEGSEDVSVYEVWLRSIAGCPAYEPLPANGKKQVLGLLRQLKNSNSELLNGLYFFVDRDFDLEAPPHSQLYELPAYSIENFLCTSEVLESILRDEFKCAGDIETRQHVHACFDKFAEQLERTCEEVNLRLFTAARLGRKVSCKPEKISQIASIGVETASPVYQSIDQIISIDPPLTLDEISGVRDQFQSLPRLLRHRGKYALEGFRKWLRLVSDDLKSEVPRLFPKRNSASGDPSSASHRRFATGMQAPESLSAFCAACFRN